MPFIETRVLQGMRGPARNSLREFANELESDLNAPVRILQPERGRTVEGFLNRWQGGSGEARHYTVDNAGEAMRERGITILSHCFNESITDDPEWDYTNFPQEFIDTWRPRYNPAEGGEEPHMEFEVRSPYTEDIEQSGGHALTFDGAPWGAIYEGRLMFVHVPLSHPDAIWGIPNWEAWIGTPLREGLDPEARERAARAREAAERQVFTNMMRDQGDAAVIDLRSRIAEIGIRIGRAQEALVNDQASIDQLGRQLNTILNETGDVTPEQIEQEWDAIGRMEGVRSFRLRDGGVQGRTGQHGGVMIVETDDLWLENPDTHRKVPLGQFTISLDFGMNNIRFRNNTIRPQNRWDHPHISEGELCAQDFRTTLTTMLRRRQLSGLLGMCFSILRIVTTNDQWGRANWPLWEDADNRKREQEGWPAWTPDEQVHPALAAAENQEQQEVTA